jgi:hypothetical protein
MPATRLIAINNSGGALTTINVSIPCRRMEIVEDASANAGAKQGLIFQWLLDGFANTYQAAAGDEPLVIQNSMTQGRGQGPLLGLPQQNTPGAFNFRAADPVIKVKSSSANPTTVRVTEFE